MSKELDLHDIQGNIMLFYPEFGFVKGRNLLFEVKKGDHGRAFIVALMPYITSSAPWKSEVDKGDGVKWPEATSNVSFTYNGLKKLGISVQTLQSFPDEFIMGMRGRRTILGDDGSSAPDNWDKIWHKDVHIFVAIGGPNDAAIKTRYDLIISLKKDYDGVILLDGHRGKNREDLSYQDISVLYENELPTPKEHFGYSDGISNPFFKGMTPAIGEVIGGGKKSGKDKNGYGNPESELTWEPLETGEFILGHKDEAQEYPIAPMPPLMAKNGSFQVYRKLHENVGKFNEFLEEQSKIFPGGKEELAAKMAGRWRNGVPITTYPNEADANALAEERGRAQFNIIKAETPVEKIKAAAAFREINKKFVGFDYDKDIDGGSCPVGAHMRRMNPRGSLEFGNKEAFDTPSALADRRRILRRGLPYGKAESPDSNDGEHGIIFIAIVANIKRQFEFVQQQWMNYGNDFKLANDKDPLLGNHHADESLADNRMIIEGDIETKRPPHFLCNMPRFVETHGGEYFFIPSLTALRMIGKGIIDPT